MTREEPEAVATLPGSPPEREAIASRGLERPSLGAIPGPEGCVFTVWAPRAGSVAVELLDGAGGLERLEPLAAGARGYHTALVEGVEPGQRYRWRLRDAGGEQSRPDPASRSQPEGVHGPSEVVAVEGGGRRGGAAAPWSGPPLERYVLYEIHVGTFTPEGTLDAVIPRLDALRELGVTAIELMPVAQFPGTRNWGYDGTFPFAAQNSYGGPEGLRRLVDACHVRDLAVVLDVVYNHLGPEGNVLGDFGPYFTERYRTPWGAAVNFDDAGSDEVRHYFIENALWWTRDVGVDALRLDAVHAIHDASAVHVLEALASAVHAAARRDGRRVLVIAESDLNDPRLVRERERGGYGLDAQWSDDFHHALHALVTGERDGYYRDFGRADQLADAWRHAFAYRGQRSSFRGRRHGRPPVGVPAARFVVYAQNHDQIGNRARGDRLAESVDFETLKTIAATTLLSPFTPLLFMGEEYGEPAPFPYFTSHSDPELVEAVRRGRREEFAAFGWSGEVPDPQAEATFRSAIPNPARASEGRHRALLELHRELLRLRARLDDAGLLRAERRVETPVEATLLVVREAGEGGALLLLNLGVETAAVPDLPAGVWARVLHTGDARWLGPGVGPPGRLSASPPESLREHHQEHHPEHHPERTPDHARAGAALELTLPPRSATLYLRGKGRLPREAKR